MTKNKLFSNFDPVSSKAFKQKIQFDLKGASYNDTLVWNTNEGIDIKPFYHRDETTHFPEVPGLPATWHIGEDIFIHDTSLAVQTANNYIASGAEALYFSADAPFDARLFFNTLDKTYAPIYFKLHFLDENFYQEIIKEAGDRTVYLNIDLIHHLAEEGNWYHNLAEDHRMLDNILQKETHTISIDIDLYQNAGATMVQQLAYGLAHANEYLLHLNEMEVSIPSITFQVAIGSNYFFEIAKLRALRQLITVLKDEYAFAKAATTHIIARPTRRNKTIYDYNTNMLRTTTEAMSAVLGGADTVINMPYDYIYHKTNDFGQRISRNQLIILKKESYFDAVSNPSDGTYYIEAITKQLAEKALALFKDIEQQGGFLKQLKEGTIQRKIKESAQKEQTQFDTQEKILLGTNKHPNPSDRMKDSLELYPFVKIKPRKTLIEPIIKQRLSEKMEQERLKTEA
ncbi:methylmalonyl-CoA mutase [Dokdonia pacifica]|uniref:Heterodimeric methylmalonyl-CoA mutase small subunit n=1 Tax=Dokdonia pacifica TaxID=1627892 RepID=A0A238ZD51_9FLAO|nr:methylmalonyl-CoA mutase subunit beta [Dokdonia pacifica]GGG05424.1 methylmalonyl-CoA mutase [Dokdonia pacifica]SNR80693.1 heterodimeric methylmalonyl-CoA mutase small subunit [Dokdonia pacifica]